MTAMWITSYVLLWLLVIGEGILILALARQIGILHTRIGKTGARITNVGLELGEEAPRLSEQDLNGYLVTLGVERGKPTLLIFLSPNCSICKELAPAIRTLSRRESKNTEVIVVSISGNRDENEAYAKRHKLDKVPYLLAPHIGERYLITATPYAILVDANGKVYTKGMVNQIEQLESLLNALHEGHPSYDSKMNHLIALESRDIEV